MAGWPYGKAPIGPAAGSDENRIEQSRNACHAVLRKRKLRNCKACAKAIHYVRHKAIYYVCHTDSYAEAVGTFQTKAR